MDSLLIEIQFAFAANTTYIVTYKIGGDRQHIKLTCRRVSNQFFRYCRRGCHDSDNQLIMARNATIETRTL